MKIFGLGARKTYPTKLTIDINTQCNGKCIVCPYSTIKNRLKHGIMDWNLYRKIIDDYADICYQNKIMGELSYCNMSEPTLLPNFPDFIKYARSKGCFTIYFNTNVSKLTPEMIDTFIRDKTFPAIHLNIMAFDKKRYEEIMGLDYELLLKHLNYLLKKYPHCLIDIGFLTPLLNKENIETIRNFFQNSKVYLNFGTDVNNRAGNVSLPGQLSDSTIHTKKRSLGCLKNRPIHRMHINYDGHVYLCDQDMSIETKLGNVADSTIQDIWTGKTMMDTLRIIYGIADPGNSTHIPCFRCASCIDNNNIKLWENPRDFKPRKLFGPVRRWLVKNGYAAVRKRGKIALL